MDVWRITMAALRRWYVLLPLLGATGLLAMLVGQGVAPEYEARAAAMLTPGRTATEVPNPYGSITSANQAVGIVLNSTESRSHIAEQGLVASYEVGAAARSAIIQFSVRGPDSEAAVETGHAVFELAVEELSGRQSDAGIPESAQITLEVLEDPAVVSVVQSGKTRIQAVIAVAGAAGALLISVLFDDIVGLLTRRRHGRQVRDDRPASVTPSEADDALIHTDQWVWPDEQRPVASGGPRRNPYFDPEFTKRSRAKSTAPHPVDEALPVNGSPERPNNPEQSNNGAMEPTRHSASIHRP